jgi:hypothetical protein
VGAFERSDRMTDLPSVADVAPNLAKRLAARTEDA